LDWSAFPNRDFVSDLYGSWATENPVSMGWEGNTKPQVGQRIRLLGARAGYARPDLFSMGSQGGIFHLSLVIFHLSLDWNCPRAISTDIDPIYDKWIRSNGK
jgi:hypothetical protein